MTSGEEVAAAVAAARSAAAAAVGTPEEGKVTTLVGEHEKRIKEEEDSAKLAKSPVKEEKLSVEQGADKPAAMKASIACCTAYHSGWTRLLLIFFDTALLASC